MIPCRISLFGTDSLNNLRDLRWPTLWKMLEVSAGVVGKRSGEFDGVSGVDTDDFFTNSLAKQLVNLVFTRFRVNRCEWLSFSGLYSAVSRRSNRHSDCLSGSFRLAGGMHLTRSVWCTNVFTGFRVGGGRSIQKNK